MTAAVWTALYAELPLHEALRTLAAHGWCCFEVSTEHLVRLDSAPPTELESALQTVTELGITLPQAHAYLQANVAAADAKQREQDIETVIRHLALCARLRVDVAVVHPGGTAVESAREPDTVRALNREAFRRIADIAASLGLRIGVENLMRPGASHPEDMIALLDDIGHEAVGVVLDTSHANVTRLDIPDTISALGARLIGTHISDNDGSGDQHRTPGSGLIDWPPLAAALRRIGYAGPFNLEIPGERHANLELRALKSRHAREVAEWLVGLSSA